LFARKFTLDALDILAKYAPKLMQFNWFYIPIYNFVFFSSLLYLLLLLFFLDVYSSILSLGKPRIWLSFFRIG
jgi:hypothetical protein